MADKTPNGGLIVKKNFKNSKEEDGSGLDSKLPTVT